VLSRIRALPNILFILLVKGLRPSVSLSSVAIFTSPIRGACDHGDQPNVLLPRGRNPHRSHEDFVTLVYIKVPVRVESSTSIVSSQGDDIMVEDVERETLSGVSREVRLEEIVSPLEEIPSMVKLDTPQPRKGVLFIFGAEKIVESGCREDCSGANGTGNKLVFLASDEIQDGRVESGHEVVRVEGTASVVQLEDWVNHYIPSVYID
jgi:hypothetical protein